MSRSERRETYRERRWGKERGKESKGKQSGRQSGDGRRCLMPNLQFAITYCIIVRPTLYGCGILVIVIIIVRYVRLAPTTRRKRCILKIFQTYIHILCITLSTVISTF